MNKSKFLIVAGLVVVIALSLVLSSLALARSSDDGETKILLSGNDASSGTGKYSTVQLVNGQQQTELTVTGTGKVTVKPDIAVVNLGVQVEDKTVSAAQQTASQAMSAIMASLSDNGIADKDIKTVNFSIQPVWNSSSYPSYQSTLKGYQVSNMLSITIRDTTKVGVIIDAAAEAAGDPIRVDNIYFTVEKPEPLYDQARELAVNDAMVKAQKTADRAGVKLGNINSISENTGYYGGYETTFPVAAGSPSGSVATTPIISGESEISTSVQMVYSIEQ